MLEQFLDHIRKNNLVSPGSKVLVAVSGGIDSMVMLSLSIKANIPVGVAHVNFGLRGTESDGDADFVAFTCEQYGVSLHTVKYDTSRLARERGESIQVTARALRYDYFERIAKDYGYSCVATAHHADDNLETVLLNLTRGTGVEGLLGIPVKRNDGTVIRPMLFATRESIEGYARQEGLTWREDSSNAQEKYQRNHIRHNVIPQLKKLNPGLGEAFADTLRRIEGVWSLASRQLELFNKDAIRDSPGGTSISLSKLRAMPAPGVVLWELLKGKGFSFDVCRDVVDNIHQTGKQFFADNFQLTVDRDLLLLTSRSADGSFEVAINRRVTELCHADVKLTFEYNEGNRVVNDASIAQLDLDKIEFPIIWRPWRHGDSFQPLGMKQTKKVSDFLIDAKVSRPDKEKITVLESNGSLVWVVGHRVDDRFKVTAQTQRMLTIKKV